MFKTRFDMYNKCVGCRNQPRPQGISMETVGTTMHYTDTGTDLYMCHNHPSQI